MYIIYYIRVRAVYIYIYTVHLFLMFLLLFFALKVSVLYFSSDTNILLSFLLLYDISIEMKIIHSFYIEKVERYDEKRIDQRHYYTMCDL